MTTLGLSAGQSRTFWSLLDSSRSATLRAHAALREASLAASEDDLALLERELDEAFDALCAALGSAKLVLRVARGYQGPFRASSELK